MGDTTTDSIWGRSDLTCPLTQIVSPGGQRGSCCQSQRLPLQCSVGAHNPRRAPDSAQAKAEMVSLYLFSGTQRASGSPQAGYIRGSLWLIEPGWHVGAGSSGTCRLEGPEHLSRKAASPQGAPSDGAPARELMACSVTGLFCFPPNQHLLKAFFVGCL